MKPLLGSFTSGLYSRILPWLIQIYSSIYYNYPSFSQIQLVDILGTVTCFSFIFFQVYEYTYKSELFFFKGQ